VTLFLLITKNFVLLNYLLDNFFADEVPHIGGRGEDDPLTQVDVDELFITPSKLKQNNIKTRPNVVFSKRKQVDKCTFSTVKVTLGRAEE
jgi:hypothetical protein